MITEVFHQLPALLKKHKIEVKGIIHVGACDGEEMPIYRTLTKNITLIEPNPEMRDKLKAFEAEGVAVISEAVGLTFGVVTLHKTKNRQRCSILRPLNEEMDGEEKVTMMPLRLLHTWCENILVVDVQGMELDVLESDDLSRYDAIICEMDEEYRYEGEPKPDDIVEYLWQNGFDFDAMFRHDKPGQHIIDGFFVRRKEPAKTEEPQAIAEPIPA